MLISEIARMARVSPATVSRAINQPDLVAPASLARIQGVMEKNNYVPAPLSRRRGPKTRLTGIRRIGVWFVGGRATNPNLDWFLEQFHHIQPTDPRNRVDVRLLYSNTPDDLPAGMAVERLDGVIIQGMEPSPGCLAKMKDIPHVWFMTRRSPTFAGDYVEPDNEENGHMAADYLKAQGHTSVAVVTTDPEYSAISRRMAAFIERARILGLEIHSILGKPNPGVSYLEIAPLHGESEQLARRLLASKPKPTGLYLPVDHFCGAFFRALRGAGQQSGRDFEAILGNFNPIVYHNLDHFPAAIDINLETLVRKVIDHLLWRMENPAVPGRVGVRVSPTLVKPAPGARTGA